MCQNQARLTPTTNSTQICHSSHIEIVPPTSYLQEYTDYFNNKVTVFEIATQHKELTVTMVSEVELLGKKIIDLSTVDMCLGTG